MIFADTSFWVALVRPKDPHHPEADELARAHVRSRLVTTNHVRGETWTFLRRKEGQGVALRAVDHLETAALLEIVHVSLEMEAQALRWLRRHDERPYSFVDATSFALMRSLKIREALAFDGRFSAAGFVELRP